MTFKIYTLGCKVNMYETNVMTDQLKNAGYRETDQDLADIYIINTCSVTNTADHKSLKMIRQAIRKNPAAMIIVAGCLAQQDQNAIKMIDGVDIIIGNINKSKIVYYIEQWNQEQKQITDVRDIQNTSFETMRLNNFNHTRAFVKIQDGCNHFCSYCIIPYTRGNVRSKKREDVLHEVKTLIQNGHKEIVLTGIHTGNYGAEFDHYRFADLLKELVEISGLERLRISSIEMNELNDQVLQVIKSHDILVDHLHIPLQSGSNFILEKMNRTYTKEDFIQKIEQIRKIRPNISITTDIIVGFPGETEELFEETIDTISKIQFTKLHVFPYSKRTGTVAATMDHQIEEQTKKRRVKQLLALSQKLELHYMAQQIGRQLTFLPEVYKDGYLIGHTGNYLLVQTEGTREELNQPLTISLTQIEYPYMKASRSEIVNV